ncbi:MAG: hypothetical protein Q6363_002975, partial [Candidatus Njordarchaeota archaeon]
LYRAPTRLIFSNIIDWIVGFLPKHSIYLFEVDGQFSYEDFTNALAEKLNLSDGELPRLVIFRTRIGHRPILRWIYVNANFRQAYMYFEMKGKKERIVTPGGRLKIQYSYILALVVLRDKSRLIEVRINSKINQALLSVGRALEVLGLGVDVKINKINFNSLSFIRRMLGFADAVGYLTLEFTGPSISPKERGSRYGKITYSGRRLGGEIDDLRRDEEVKEKIEKAFAAGGITKMHGTIKVDLTGDPKLKFDDPKLSFGINFRENKVYLFSGATEAGYAFLINKIYDIWRGVSKHEKTAPTLDLFLA